MLTRDVALWMALGWAGLGCQDPAGLESLPDLTATVTLTHDGFRLRLQATSGPHAECPMLNDDVVLEMDGQPIPLLSNGSSDDAACRAQTVFGLPLSQVQNPERDLVIFTLKDSTKSLVMKVSGLFKQRSLIWVEPTDHVVVEGNHMVFEWNGPDDVLQWPECLAHASLGDSTVFDAALADEDGSPPHLGFVAPAIPSHLSGSGTLALTIRYKAKVLCQGFSSCQVPDFTDDFLFSASF